MKKIITSMSLASLVVLVFAAIANAAVIGTVSTSPGTVTTGQSVTISGSCGSAGSNGVVAILLSNGSSAQSANVAANFNGDFSANVLVQPNFASGQTAVTATCPNGNTLTGTLTVSGTIPVPNLVITPTGSTLTLNGNPILGQGLAISGSCGTTAGGGNVSVNLVRSGSVIILGSTSTTGSNGNFSSTFTVPSNAGGGPVAIVANCPTGAVTFNTGIIDPSASVAISDLTPTIGGNFTVTGVCGTTAGGSVSFTLSNPTTQIILGTTTTNANGTFATSLTMPAGFAAGPALLTATCPTGNVIMSSVTINPASSGGSVNLGSSTTTPTSSPGTTSGATATTPSGGVAAGRTSNSLTVILAMVLVALGALSFLGNKKLNESNDL